MGVFKHAPRLQFVFLILSSGCLPLSGRYVTGKHPYTYPPTQPKPCGFNLFLFKRFYPPAKYNAIWLVVEIDPNFWDSSKQEFGLTPSWTPNPSPTEIGDDSDGGSILRPCRGALYAEAWGRCFFQWDSWADMKKSKEHLAELFEVCGVLVGIGGVV